MATTKQDSSPNLNDTNLYPVWNDDGKNDVQSLFKNPYFVGIHAKEVGQAWYDHMTWSGIFLFDTQTQPNTVFEHGAKIYQKIAPPDASMPEPVQYYDGKFPAEAVEKFRKWYNQGGRVKTSDPYPNSNIPNPLIPAPTPEPPVRAFVIPKNPVWDAQGSEDDIKQCFTDPCWIPNRRKVADDWAYQMSAFQYDATADPNEYVNLQKYEHVKGWARNIYMHVKSRSMPISAPYFSDEACEAFRRWYNHGCPQFRVDIDKVLRPKNPIDLEPVEKPFIVRKDINTLTAEELTAYRMALLRLQAEGLDNSIWQVGGFLHANWCLHYMEASFPWHRAHLLWLENQIGAPIPYWNFFSSKATDPSSPDSGIPQAFLDDTFTDSDGNTHSNPLRHAYARDGVSRVSTKARPVKEVQRAQPFVQPDGPIKRDDYIKQYVPSCLDTIYLAMQMTDLGQPQKHGYPFTWAADMDHRQDLNDLQVENNAAFYAQVQNEFDGVLEQGHDNLHGWVGPDMANNSFAAFDPLFWSFHSNFDRLFEMWIREHEQIQWSSNFPLRPFIGREGKITIDEGDKFTYRYTTIGNMVVDSKALGYTYAPPGSPDYAPAASKISHDVAPIVLFPNVNCTNKTYIIHVALNPHNDSAPLVIDAPGYVGSITRLGMGPNNGNDRCITGFVVKRLEAGKAMADLDCLIPNTPVPLKVLVLEDNGGIRREVPASECEDWNGFRPLLVWAKPIAGVVAH